MIRLSRRSRFGPAVLCSALLGLGSAAGLASAPHAIAQPDEFSCRATVLNVQGQGPLSALHVEPFVANNPNDPCRTSAATGLNVALPTGPGDHVSVLSAQTTDNESFTGNSTASADARVAEAQVGGTLLRAQVLTAHADGRDPDGLCGPEPATFSGDSHVAQVTLNGTVIEVPAGKSDPAHPTLEVPGVLKLFLREESGSSTTGFTERALELQLAGVLTVVISEAKVGLGAHPNTAGCVVTPQCTGPETDPFVDPTAEDTQGLHPDCAEEFTEPKGDGDNTAHDFVHFTRSIMDTETSPNNSFTPDNSDEDSRNRFNGKAGFFEDGDTTPSIEGDFYDDEDMHFRLEPETIDAFFAPNDLAASPWRRFCGTGVIEAFNVNEDGSDDTVVDEPGEEGPTAPFAEGQERKFLVETFDAKTLDDTRPGGDQSDYWVIDIYAPGSDFDTTQCDPAPGDHDHGEASNPFRDDLDYHSEGQTIAGNIEIHSGRIPDDDPIVVIDPLS